jgi:purine nucleosidase
LPAVYSCICMAICRSCYLTGRERYAVTGCCGGICNTDIELQRGLRLRRYTRDIQARVKGSADNVKRTISRKPVILDTDIGTDVDDAYALALAATLPEMDLRAVTTVFGDTMVRARVASKVLSLVHRRDVPVSAGASCSFAGNSGWWGGWEGEELGPEEVWPVSPLPAVNLISRVLRESPQPVTIICIGALTNVALALREPGFRRESVERFVIMGGTLSDIVVENVRLPRAWETNLHNDIAAAVEVFGAGIPISLVPADVTFHTRLDRQNFQRLRECGSGIAATLVRMTDRYLGEWQPAMQRLGVTNYYADAAALLHDPLTVLLAAGYEVAEWENIRVEVKRCNESIEIRRSDTADLVIEVAGKLRAQQLSVCIIDHLLSVRA